MLTRVKLNQLFGSLLNVILETPCPLCQRSSARVFCSDCDRQLLDCRWAEPDRDWSGSLPVFAWGAYQHALKRAIAVLKYDNQPQLAPPLGFWLAEAWLNSPVSRTTTKLVVVPIPLHPTKQAQRGYNQAELLAQAFCQVAKLPMQRHGLSRQRATAAQFGLAAPAREQNLADAFAVGQAFRRRPPTQSILLLDDIYTTGATARSAARTLRRSGIRVEGIVTLAQAKV